MNKTKFIDDDDFILKKPGSYILKNKITFFLHSYDGYIKTCYTPYCECTKSNQTFKIYAEPLFELPIGTIIVRPIPKIDGIFYPWPIISNNLKINRYNIKFIFDVDISLTEAEKKTCRCYPFAISERKGPEYNIDNEIVLNDDDSFYSLIDNVDNDICEYTELCKRGSLNRLIIEKIPKRNKWF